MDKDFRPGGDANDSERERLAALAAHEISQAGARPITPVQMFDKPTYPDTKVIQYTEDGRPISPRYDEAPAEVAAPKDSPAQGSVPTSLSPSSPASVAGQGGTDSGQNPETTASAGRVSEPPTAPVQPSVPTMPTPPGKNGQSA